MNRKRMLRYGLDALMLVLLVFLMTYELIGEATHEGLGIGMFACITAHQALNIPWYRSLGRGRFTAARALAALVDLALLADLAMQFVSGVILSRHALAFLPIHGGRFAARSFHVVGAYWGMVLMAFHLGMHMDAISRRLRGNRTDSPRRRRIMRAGALLIALYGAYALVKRQMIDYMVLRIPFVYFDFSEPLIFYILDVVAIIALFALMGHYAMGLAKTIDRRNRHTVGGITNKML